MRLNVVLIANGCLDGSSSIRAGLIQDTSRAASQRVAGSPAATKTAATLAKATILKMITAKLTKVEGLAFTIATLLATFAPCTGLVHSAYGEEFEDDDLKNLTTDAADLVSPSIVRFSYGKESSHHFGCGVIVSPEGHIAVSGPVHAVIDNELMQLRLSDGRIVKGEALGWSSEFGFGLLKIANAGPWPHVEMNHRPRVGQVSVALGCSRGLDQSVATAPDTSLGLVTKSSRGRWLTTSHRNQFNSHPVQGASGGGVFDTEGRLIGVLLGGNSEQMNHTRVEIFLKNWNTLTANRHVHALESSSLKDASAKLSRIEKELSAK